MNYSSTYFNKSLQELAYADVEEFFSVEREESDQIEFKSHHPKIQNEDMVVTLSKAIASFLNSSGGLVVWGAPQEVKGKGAKHAKDMFRGQLTDIPPTYTKDSIVSKISDRIVPLPSGIRVRFIEGEGTQRVCIIEVDESPTSPHQTAGVYFMRMDGQKRNAPHHYIEAMFKRITFPRLEARIKPLNIGIAPREDAFIVGIEFLFFNLSPLENEEDFIYRILLLPVGEFVQAMPGAIKVPGYTTNGSEYRTPDPTPVHSYGEVIRNVKQLHFSTDELVKYGNKAKIILIFGGRKSPKKSNSYVINFDQVSPDNPEAGFTIEYENITLAELQEAKGATQESTLEAMGVLRTHKQ